MSKFIKITENGNDNWINLDMIIEIAGNSVRFSDGSIGSYKDNEIEAILRNLDVVEEITSNGLPKSSIDRMEMGNLVFGNSRGEYEIPRTQPYEGVIMSFLERSGFDEYGHVEDPRLEPFWNDDKYCFENDVFILRPYYWGDDENIIDLPNFVFKPDGTEISWYKYPLRDSYCNKDISPDDFARMFAECEKSLDGIFGGTARSVERPETLEECMQAIQEIIELQ